MIKPMAPSQALKIVSDAYVPGAVAYYSGLKPDPWEQTHLLLGNQIEQPDIHGPPNYNAFAQRLLELIERFRRDGTVQRSVSPADAFQISDPTRLEAIESLYERKCRACEGKKTLRIYPVAGHKTQVELLCDPCSKTEKRDRG